MSETTTSPAVAAAKGNAEAMIAGDMARVMQDLAPEGMVKAGGLGLSGKRFSAYEIRGEEEVEGGVAVTTLLEGDEPALIRLTWAEKGGSLLIVDAARLDLETGEAEAPVFVPPGLKWMNANTEWGMRARPGPEGLTVSRIMLGSYGYVPDTWDNLTMLSRGSAPLPGVEAMGYSIFEKQEVWADNAPHLYEEAIQRRWRPATDIDWASIQPLPEDLERAIGQVCTAVSEQSYAGASIIGGWLKQISYGFIEVKLYLGTDIFDRARHAEAFRKRALCNGGGLGMQGSGLFLRTVNESKNFTEMATMLMLLNDSFLLTLFRFLEVHANNQAERQLYALAAQDKTRHVAYASEHLKFALLHKPQRSAEVHKYLEKAERMLAHDVEADVPFREALTIGFGQGDMAKGHATYQLLRRRQVESYLQHLEAGHLRGRRERLHPDLAKFLPQET